MFRVAMISKWHVHAAEYGRQLREEIKDAKVTCVWDDDTERGKEWAKEFNAEFVASLDEVLAREDVDGVVIDAATSMHPEILEKAAKAKKHIFTEKVMTLGYEDALRISKIIEENGVKFCIAFYQRTFPYFLYAKQAVESGMIGKPTMMRTKNGHNGAIGGWLPEYWFDKKTTGGGAMMDLGCHPMYLARWILGEPKSINSSFTYLTGRDVEDNAVCTVEFKNGAIGVVESSLTVANSPYIMEIYGTEGSVYIFDGEVKVYSPKSGKDGWFVPEVLPEALMSPLHHWVDCCVNDKTPIWGLEDAVQLSMMMDAAYRSAETGTKINF